MKKKKTRSQINRQIKSQLRRCKMTPLEKKLRRIMLRRATGLEVKRVQTSH